MFIFSKLKTKKNLYKKHKHCNFLSNCNSRHRFIRDLSSQEVVILENPTVERLKSSHPEAVDPPFDNGHPLVCLHQGAQPSHWCQTRFLGWLVTQLSQAWLWVAFRSLNRVLSSSCSLWLQWGWQGNHDDPLFSLAKGLPFCENGAHQGLGNVSHLSKTSIHPESEALLVDPGVTQFSSRSFQHLCRSRFGTCHPTHQMNSLFSKNILGSLNILDANFIHMPSSHRIDILKDFELFSSSEKLADFRLVKTNCAGYVGYDVIVD